MENKMQIFNNTQFGDIRVVMRGDEPWFVAADVCRALEVKNPSDALCRLDADERTLVLIEGASNGLPVNAVNEPGLYSLVLGSRKPEAKAFRRWITHDVIPSIRQHGAYMTPETIQNVLSNPDLIISLATQLKEVQAKAAELAAINAVQEQAIADFEPIKQYVDTILESSDALTVTQIAADYDISAVRLNKILNEESVQRKVNDQWVLYNDYMGKGYTTSKTYKYTHSDGSAGTAVSTLWTQKGRLLIHNILRARDITPIMDRSIS